MTKFSRRSFLKTAGIATGAAIVSGVPGAATAAAAAEGNPEIVVKPSAMPHEPLVAYVRNVDKGEVTVVSGLHETTFKDYNLVKRILKATTRHPQTKHPIQRNGGVA